MIFFSWLRLVDSRSVQEWWMDLHLWAHYWGKDDCICFSGKMKPETPIFHWKIHGFWLRFSLSMATHFFYKNYIQAMICAWWSMRLAMPVNLKVLFLLEGGKPQLFLVNFPFFDLRFPIFISLVLDVSCPVVGFQGSSN